MIIFFINGELMNAETSFGAQAAPLARMAKAMDALPGAGNGRRVHVPLGSARLRDHHAHDVVRNERRN